MASNFGKAFTLGAAVMLIAVIIAGQAQAAAKASDVDPLRERVGQIVYPLGVHAPKDTGKTKGVAAHYPKAKGSTVRESE